MYFPLSQVALLCAAALSPSLALADTLSPRANPNAALCSSVNNDCQNNKAHFAFRYCSSVLDIPGRPSVITTYLASATITKSTTVTHLVKQCPTQGPPKKRDLLGRDAITARAQVTAAASSSYPAPPCFSPFTSNSADISSACNCFDFTVTSSDVTRTLRHGFDFTTTTTTTTSATGNPGCTPTTGAKKWKPFYQYCGIYRNPIDSLKAIYYPSNLGICSALQQCANDPAAANALTLAMTWHAYPGEDAQWECFLFSSNTSVANSQLELAPNWPQNYGYAISS